MVNQRLYIPKLPIVFAISSLFFLLFTLLFISPIGNVAHVMLFFLGLFTFLTSFGYVLSSILFGTIGWRGRFRVTIVSVFLTLTLMFKSIGSLTLVDIAVLATISIGLLFYGARRTPDSD